MPAGNANCRAYTSPIARAVPGPPAMPTSTSWPNAVGTPYAGAIQITVIATPSATCPSTTIHAQIACRATSRAAPPARGGGRSISRPLNTTAISVVGHARKLVVTSPAHGESRASESAINPIAPPITLAGRCNRHSGRRPARAAKPSSSNASRVRRGTITDDTDGHG